MRDGELDVELDVDTVEEVVLTLCCCDVMMSSQTSSVWLSPHTPRGCRRSPKRNRTAVGC